MGSEQSREVTDGTIEVKGGNTAQNNPPAEDDDDLLSGRDSPRPSISSEADLPYISYTVNRPIGDSPKHTSKGVRSFRSSAAGTATRKLRKRAARPQEIVVVREANSNVAVDPELSRIQHIPTFLPIMRGALTAPSTRDPEVLERLDTTALRGLCRRYQVHLYAAASLVTSHQDKVNTKIKEVDGELNTLVAFVTDRQRTFARHAERLAQVTDVCHLLSRCHSSLNQVLESMEALNESLPLEDRLEPFVWTTG